MNISDVKDWFKAVGQLRVQAKSFSDQPTLDVLETQIKKMNCIYKLLTGNQSPLVIQGECVFSFCWVMCISNTFVTFPGLSKSLRDVLRYMANREDVTVLSTQLAELVHLHNNITDVPTVLNLDRQDLVDWAEGIEHLRTKTEDELYALLGFNDKKIPFLVTEIDVEPDLEALACPDEDACDIPPPLATTATKRPFALKWHQLVGVVKMLECARTCLPTMLMDDVGLGKTLEVIAFFTVIAYYCAFYNTSK